MSLRYDVKLDKIVGHDYPGAHHNGFYQYEVDEIELGARVAIQIDDPEQWFWEIYREHIERDLQNASSDRHPRKA